MAWIDRGSHRVHYQIVGGEDRPPVLLIMGLAFSSRAWHTLPEKLAKRFRVITFDNAGTGKSSAPKSIDLAQMADDAAAVLDAAKVPQVSVFGISMGGMIAMELALRHPHRIHRLALGATHAGYWRSRKPDLRTTAGILVAGLLGQRTSAKHLARFLVSKPYYARDAEGFARWLAVTEPAHPFIVFRQMLAILNHRAEHRLKRIDVPTLVVTGDRDLLVPHENSRRIVETIEGAELVELEEVGHCFPVERPDEVSAVLDRFFSAGRGEGT